MSLLLSLLSNPPKIPRSGELEICSFLSLPQMSSFLSLPPLPSGIACLRASSLSLLSFSNGITCLRGLGVARGGQMLAALLPLVMLGSTKLVRDGGPIEGAGRHAAQLPTLIPGGEMFAPAGQSPYRTVSHHPLSPRRPDRPSAPRRFAHPASAPPLRDSRCPSSRRNLAPGQRY